MQKLMALAFALSGCSGVVEEQGDDSMQGLTTVVTLEAESGTLHAPFYASNGAILQNGSTMNMGTGNGLATYTFTAPSDGNYIITGVVNAPNTGSNSFFINI